MKRWAFVVAVAALFAGTGLDAAEDETLRVYYGTRTASGSQGIYTGTLNLETGTLSDPQLAAEAENPGFLAISHSGRFLYSVANSKAGNWIVAFAIDRDSGKLTELNRQEVGGANPCHVSVGPDDRYVVYANYTGGSCGMMPLADDGSLLPRSSFFQHSGGSGVNERRQRAPHPHSARTAPGGELVMVPDLGQDKVRIYRVAADGRSMTPNDSPFATTPPGGGPRHVAFARDGRSMYVNNELTSSVTVFDLNPSTGVTEAKQTISTLPESFDGNNSTAEILVHPSGRFVYCSNRGHDSIAAFAIDETTGMLTAIGRTSSGGNTPRNFGITPDGRYVIAANQNSDDVAVLKVDPETGALSPTGSSIKVPHCICVRFVE
ncbi:MAG: lactonase family protein [Maioricimonas sp. JB049]